MPIDVAAARALTPGCEQVLHLNHAGASLLPQPVLDAVVGHLEREAQVGGYEAEADAREALEATYGSIATLLGARPHEIALVDSASRGWISVVSAFGLTEDDTVVVTRSEYGANAITLLHLQHRTGCGLALIEDDDTGALDLDDLEAILETGSVAFVSLVHVPTQSGLVNPAAEVGARCRAAGVPFVLDACQSAGQLPLDVDALGCDVLTATGRKFLRGPRGTGFAYVREALLPRLEPLLLDLHAAEWTGPASYEIRSDARRFEMWESDVAARLGLGAAVDHALGWGVDAIAAYDADMAASLRTRLGEIPGVTVRDEGPALCAITTFTVDGHEPEALRQRLRAAGVNVSASVASSAMLDLPHRGLDAVVRASVHYTTTEEELDRFATTLSSIVGGPAA